MGKKNLDSILIKSEKVLPDSQEKTLLSKKAGRPTKPANERESEVVSIKITPRELANMKERAGELVPLGTFMKHYLRTQTDLFTKPESNE